MEQECCPKFNPKPWDGREFTWNDKKFIKGRVITLFYMPINFGSVMRKLNEQVDKAGAKVPDGLCLSDHASKWGMDVYLAVAREIPGAKNASLSGKYASKVYEGPFSDTGKWCDDFSQYAKSRGLHVGKMYMWYTTCPKCAKKYGKNYVVIVGQTG